ncbi:MAG: VWA domain-containing protein [Gammaproteobacteria bacterium]|nr:VWA domain-containing protein [Gammaproteobacteria bacterium]
MLEGLTLPTALSLPWAGFEFRNPGLLLLTLLVPVVYLLARAPAASVEYSSLRIVDLGPASLRRRLAWLPAAMTALAAASLVVALAGPRSGDATTLVKREGIAIMLVVDRSGSMNARDFVQDDYSVSRLDAVKEVIKDFVLGGRAGNGRPNDLIGIVAFGTYADSICPLTLDHGSAMSILGDLEVATEESEAATAIGEGLALAVERLREHPARSKVVVLLTDGVNNAGDVEPLQAAELATAHHIKVYTVGAGSSGIAPMPARLSDGRTVLTRQRVEIDEKTLQQIAERTGGRYFNARDIDGLARTYAAIDTLERSEISELRYLQYTEHYPLFTLLAMALLGASALLSASWLRRLP